MDEAMLRHVRVVLVSPGDVAGERSVAREVIDELNRGEAGERGLVLSLWRWETDSLPGAHLAGPQGQIDEQMRIDEADVVVAVLWKRFGTPTHNANSGTEHELRKAFAAWERRQRPHLLLYFCVRPGTPRTRDEAEQWGRVIEFREEFGSRVLSTRYDSESDFERLLREHLGRFMRARAPASGSPAGASRPEGQPRVRFNLPPINPSFTSRTRELEQLDRALAREDRAVITQAIGGLGGVGKSQLAAHYANTRSENYDIVAWIRAEDGGTADLAKLAEKLGAPVAKLPPSDRAQLAVEWLSASTQHWLLVLDNVESARQLLTLLPRGGRGRVLVTSRDGALQQFGPVLALDVFDEDTATGFLIDGSGRPHDERAARQVAGALGRLPLALSHASAYCQHGTSFTEYLDMLDDLPAQHLFAEQPESSYVQTVASTWKTSIARASAEISLAQDVLEMAAHLAPDAIPKILFSSLEDARTPGTRHRLVLAMNALGRFSLASIGDSAISVHRLLQKTVRDDVAARGERAPGRNALAAMRDAFPEDVDVAARWPRCEDLLPHVLAVADHVSQPDAASKFIDLLNRASNYLNCAEPGQRGLGVARIALSHAERLLGGEDRRTVRARGNFAFATREAGRLLEAIALYEPLLADSTRILGREHEDTLMTRRHLALTYHLLGRISEAIAAFEHLLADSIRVLGLEHRGTLSVRNHLGSSYRAAGRTGEAIALFEPLLADAERILTPEHPSTLRVRHNLAGSYREIGRIDEAMEMSGPLLADCERIVGVRHPTTLRARHDRADDYIAVGRIDEAIAIAETLRDDSQRILGHEHPHTFRSRHLLASAYLAAGRVDEAIGILEPLLDDRNRLQSAAHPDVMRTLHTLARAHLARGDAHNAIAILAPLLADRVRHLGPEHHDTLKTRADLKAAYLLCGRDDDAERLG